jgi:hypothetical protein
LHDPSAGCACKLHGVIARAGIEYEDVSSARKARERARQIAFFVARQNDSGD